MRGWFGSGALAATLGVLAWNPAPAQQESPANLTGELGCTACHDGLPGSDDVIRLRSPSLAGASERYDGSYIFSYLRTPPVRLQAGRSRMPDFGLDDRESLALAAYLSNGRSDLGGQASRDYDRARREHPGITAEMGRDLFAGLRCAACHEDGSGAQAPRDAPDLELAGRLRPEWVRDFLRKPVPVRPFGAVPGTGSRMPDFRLAPDEVEILAAALAVPDQSSEDLPAQQLTAFQKDKAERLIKDRWPCLGCHQLDGAGGRIGPDLSWVGARMRPRAIRAMIADPHGSVPGTVMPRRIIPEDRVSLAAAYLAGRTGAGVTSYLSGADHAPRTIAAGPGGPALYDRLCANCHGVSGNGDGFNARYLPVTPTRHADSAAMATRPDDTLFDGIHVGGFVLNKSHLMPGFGQDLSAPEIRALVARIRELCQCQGPAWSRDGARRGGG